MLLPTSWPPIAWLRVLLVVLLLGLGAGGCSGSSDKDAGGPDGPLHDMPKIEGPTTNPIPDLPPPTPDLPRAIEASTGG